MDQTKITLKIYTPLLRDFDDRLDKLHIKRDRFLESMIKAETEYLASELRGKHLSPKARRYISGELKRLGTTVVNVQVAKKTVEDLNAVVDATNIVRDAFINRLILFLRASDQLLKNLDLPLFVNGSAFSKTIVEPMPTSPLRAMEAVQADPLYYLRTAIEEREETGLYLFNLPAKFAGFACYLDDADVPGTEAFKARQLQADQLLAELMALESDEMEGTGQPKSEEIRS